MDEEYNPTCSLVSSEKQLPTGDRIVHLAQVKAAGNSLWS